MRVVCIVVAIACIVLLAIAACDKGTVQHNFRETDWIRYVKDERTQLCFALLPSIGAYGKESISLATVPCEQVKSLLEQMPRTERTDWDAPH